MAYFNHKSSNSFWHSPLMLIVLFCILSLFLYNIVGIAKTERETAKKKDIILSNIESLRQREKTLSENIARLKTDEGVEETIREKYQVVREGEKMVTIVDEEREALKEEAPVVDHSFWGWIKRTFSKK